ncbi:MAG: DUF1636 domain-containing protein [Pseudomonadota bacterium]
MDQELKPAHHGCADPGGAVTAHSIIVCTRCRHTGKQCLPGHELISRLKVAVDLARRAGMLDADFSVDGIACMAGCERPCTVAYRADGKSSYLFGDVDEDADIDALVAFAAQYASSEDGWTSSTERPLGLLGKTLARIPAAMVVEHQAAGQVD